MTDSPKTDTRRPIALTIAGSDSGGGAGIQADLKTFHRFGVFGTSAVTAVTAQNTVGVQAIHTIPLANVRHQIDSIVTDLRPAAMKTGMLATAELVAEVAQAIAHHGLSGYVMDPVMVATSGDRLLEADAEAALRTELMPLATVVTPNLEEAAILVGGSVSNLEEMKEAARTLVELGAGAALIKGGHLHSGVSSAADDAAPTETEAVDVLWDGATERVFRHPWVDTVHTHGTGCTLSAATAAGLALGDELPEAVERAIRYVGRAIASAPGLGRGRGPVDHFASPD
ncbi:MAG: bifunctional hydroxymethylpyrimidine kinase/phosphomethylpyrimidine kinase [Gemmatimonadetes bacterium]|nr:bifunctional hydroxymethylpyrimidine kinase/phosphomethylpyrimidine kinase [Gemmatimonadota bacterium]NNL31408.1 bifunctional hydroxymethylpyrimidine kinase/phosphomethylpyrimidine kinase [Gemmatimonadota bacterium]